jgi:hypothetical protein
VPDLTPFEARLLEKYARLENWKDHSVYKNERGEVYPETLYFMFAIKSYYNLKESNANKHPADI